MKKTILNIVIWGAIIATAGYFGYKYFFTPQEVIIQFQNEPIQKASLFKEVSATGTINPIEVVEVGTQVSGNISQVFVDFNDKVRKGQVIAKMDMRNLEASLEEGHANLAKSKMTVVQAKRDMDRMDRLFEKGAVAGVEAERAKDAYNIALENLRLGELLIKKNSVNLGYATIVSPIDGIVVSRNVDVGQTVAASFSTPTLFRIANDLSKMKIEASVDEADIGQVKIGQPVEFTVDTYAGEKFVGEVEEVQLQPILVQNVVTYNVIIIINNPNNKLLPGMTATLIIKTEENPIAPIVPNAAFTFEPQKEDFEILNKKGYSIIPANKNRNKTIWIKDGNQLIEKEVEATFTNGIHTALKAEGLNIDSVLTNLSVEIIEEEEGGNMFTSIRNDNEKKD